MRMGAVMAKSDRSAGPDNLLTGADESNCDSIGIRPIGIRLAETASASRSAEILEPGPACSALVD